MLSEGETDSAVGDIEVSVVLVDEGVTEDEGSLEWGGEVHTLESEDALGLVALGNLEDVVGRFKDVLVTGDGESKVGVRAELSAVNVLRASVGEGLEHGRDDSLGSDEDGGTGVDDGLGDLVGLVSEDDGINADNPPGFKGDGVVLEGRSGELRVNTTENERRTFFVGLVGQEESERTIRNLTFLHEHLEDGGDVVD